MRSLTALLAFALVGAFVAPAFAGDVRPQKHGEIRGKPSAGTAPTPKPRSKDEIQAEFLRIKAAKKARAEERAARRGQNAKGAKGGKAAGTASPSNPSVQKGATVHHGEIGTVSDSSRAAAQMLREARQREREALGE